MAPQHFVVKLSQESMQQSFQKQFKHWNPLPTLQNRHTPKLSLNRLVARAICRIISSKHKTSEGVGLSRMET